MIPSAVNLPLSGLPGALRMDGAKFKEKYGFQKPDFDQEVVFYCRSGMRSATASDVARRNGYNKYAYPHTESSPS
jgi:rhodanese-related sulfurtransferase